MTYLQLVNGVLARMRDDQISSVLSTDDEFAKVVVLLVNDAKTKVENAWDWNALRYDWDLTMVPSQATYELPDSASYVKIQNVDSVTDGYFLDQSSPRDFKRKKFGGGPNAKPQYYTVSGANASRNVELEFWPTPAVASAITVTGWKNQADLALDSDIITVPYLPVLYEALAMAARERGEVGGQTAMEIFGMAKKYLEDAIALDAALSPLDNIWYQV